MRRVSEQLIATWLRMHGIKYKLKQPYPHNAKYCPTFSMADLTYLEFFDMTKMGKSFRGREYLRDIKWRERIHHKYNTHLIALYSYQ